MQMTGRRPGSSTSTEMLLHSVLPGDSAAIRRLREQVFDFCVSPMAKAAVIVGPIGGGKSILATLIAYLKRLSPLDKGSASRLIQDIRFLKGKRIDPRLMSWYVEMPLTGLVDSLAETQLFGVVKGAYTGAEQRHGIFERASGGDNPDRAQMITGGVVFLDEVGDLSRALQAKLLPVLSQGVYYPVGAEGKQQHQFDGVVIAATWRNLRGRLRPDLHSRIAQHVITVPSLSDREEDFDQVLVGIEDDFLGAYRARLDRLSKCPDVDRAYWTQESQTAVGLSPADRELLRKVDWARYGNLRALSGAVERIIVSGRPTQRVIEELSVTDDHRSKDEDSLVKRVLRRCGEGGGIAGHIKAIEREARTEFKKAVKNNRSTRRELADHLGIDETKLDYQIDQLDRDRGRRKPRRGSK